MTLYRCVSSNYFRLEPVRLYFLCEEKKAQTDIPVLKHRRVVTFGLLSPWSNADPSVNQDRIPI
jgi:hypothetical protein